jgi:hypothetical protein
MPAFGQGQVVVRCRDKRSSKKGKVTLYRVHQTITSTGSVLPSSMPEEPAPTMQAVGRALPFIWASAKVSK